MKPIIVLAGEAATGKDTIADYLVAKHGFVKIGFADPMKRFCQEVFQFTDEQLWGPSECRNAPDKRYPRTCSPTHGTDVLTPRYALQTLGTDWGRNCFKHVWIDYGLRNARAVLDLYDAAASGVVFNDGRFLNEFERARDHGAKIWRVLRPEVSIGTHKSETSVSQIPLEFFDQVLDNSGTITGLYRQVELARAK